MGVKETETEQGMKRRRIKGKMISFCVSMRERFGLLGP